MRWSRLEINTFWDWKSYKDRYGDKILLLSRKKDLLQI